MAIWISIIQICHPLNKYSISNKNLTSAKIICKLPHHYWLLLSDPVNIKPTPFMMDLIEIGYDSIDTDKMKKETWSMKVIKTSRQFSQIFKKEMVIICRSLKWCRIRSLIRTNPWRTCFKSRLIHAKNRSTSIRMGVFLWVPVRWTNYTISTTQISNSNPRQYHHW